MQKQLAFETRKKELLAKHSAESKDMSDRVAAASTDKYSSVKISDDKTIVVLLLVVVVVVVLTPAMSLGLAAVTLS